ncbi:LysR substrate-binding domain-containing protein [Palleronia sp. KMU-117]|uniref:LysR substrate-binding domain-containing protein n=1 Tax=Palleronia sp. KMU-117 TaxID=3434108 RepID=UPI003D72AC78
MAGSTMGHRLPPLSWLRAFEASARHLSFTHAAEELHLTQAAISKQVKLLEHDLRERLFERKPRSLVLTKVGAAYLPKVQDAFQRLDAGTQEVFGGRQAEMLTIRAPVGYAVNWLAARLPRFFEACPDVSLRIVSSVWREESETERYDLDIRYGLGRWPGYRTDQLTWETISPICLPAVADRLSTPDDLRNERLLHVMGYQEGWATWLAAAGARAVNAGSGMHFDTSLLAFEVAANGGGVALGRRSMSDRERALGRLVAPFDLHVSLKENFYLLSPEAGAMHRDAGIFRDWLIAEAAVAMPAG